MKTTFRLVVALSLACAFSPCAFCADGLAVSAVTARQRYPWNGQVDISFEVSGELTAAQRQTLASRHEYVALRVSALDRQTGLTYRATTLEGDGEVTAGRHHLVWDMWAQGLSLVSDRVAFSVALETARADGATYCIVDLSDGPATARYPVTYCDEMPVGGWGDDCKTTRLVLRRIEPGTFTMGSPAGELGRMNSEVQHRVTLSLGYYIGVFEVTQRQWELVMGSQPSALTNATNAAMRPVDSVSYHKIRGYCLDEWWPETNEPEADSFVGRLQRKTGLALDLPTEAQWEYACRAGTTTALNDGTDLGSERGRNANLDRLARWSWNNGSNNTSGELPLSGTAVVGSFRPNAWGLYDMHGNVWEWCLDWYGYYAGDAVDPKGQASGASSGQRIRRGGSWSTEGFYCRSGCRNALSPGSSGNSTGFRLVRNLNATLTFDAGAGTAESSTVAVAQFGAPGALPGATREGYGLVGWYTEPDGCGELIREDTQISGDRTLYACWIPQQYCVIDLSAGADATNYPVTYLNALPAGGWTDDYKTTKLVLGHLPAGTFMMGSPTNEYGRNAYEYRHKVTLTKPFYMGVFEVTQRQWELVMGTRPSHFSNTTWYAERPVESVSHDTVRGPMDYEADIYWPRSLEVAANSFFGRLRARTGLPLDLPTEAQWEYACRAGTTNALNSGRDLSEVRYACRHLSKLARYTPEWPTPSTPAATADLSAGTAAVGSYRPNGWGLYDMHGNVEEMCLDWKTTLSTADATDPVGPCANFVSHVTRGGSWSDRNEYCRSASRGGIYPADSNSGCGFRVSAPGFVTVAFDAQGGTCEASERRTAQFGRITPPRAVREGYGLVGWYTGPDGTGDLLRPDTQISRDLTLYACWIPQKYCVIDLSAGADATNYPVAYLDEPPAGGWTGEYKTTKLVLSHLPAGSFMMGSPTNEYGRNPYETQRKVTLTKPFYMGVFEVTQRQWELVMGTRPSHFSNTTWYAERPVENVSYATVRGPFDYEAETYWPLSLEVAADSFFGRLRARTGLHLDLPTEAQWEYACRAGSTNALNSCRELAETYYYCYRLNKLARYTPQYPPQTAPAATADLSVGTAAVGSYQPNGWGLCDMHGNVEEMCLDWSGGYPTADETDPVGDQSFVGHVTCGGSWSSKNGDCRCASHGSIGRAESRSTCGLRVSAPGCVTVTFDAQGGACAEPQRQTVQFGHITPPRAMRAGYGVVGWYAEPDGRGELLRADTQITRDRTFYAHWLPQKYCVIDLSAGADATNYPVAYLDEPPADGWTDEYKTTKLVLSRLPAGTFLMGSPTNEYGRYRYETQHRVTLTKPFYIGVFEVTQRQWELVTGTRPSHFGNAACYARRPVENISYPLVRGTASHVAGSDWPDSTAVGADSFFGRLRARTNLALDLPTEAQWEYACRAGSTNALNSCREIEYLTSACRHLSKLARYTPSYPATNAPPATVDLSGGTAEVGSYRPNGWGLYDMHGNVDELCLDWWNYMLPAEDLTDPVGERESFTMRVRKGGNWWSEPPDCRSAARASASPSETLPSAGVRAALSE